MAKSPEVCPDYGNWVSARLVYIPAALVLLFAGLSLLLPWLIIFAVLFFLCFIYFGYARYKFSPNGGNIQALVQGQLLDSVEWKGIGKVIDIGCGSGALTIGIAKRFPELHITGVDNWSGGWEYSKGICEQNSLIEKVSDRVDFQKASASSLPFEDETFHIAVSNLTFHEVGDIRDKRLLIKEALRVIRKGGSFVFQDLFLWKALYGEMEDLLATIRDWGVEEVKWINTSNSTFIPKALKLPFMVGTISILVGRK